MRSARVAFGLVFLVSACSTSASHGPGATNDSSGPSPGGPTKRPAESCPDGYGDCNEDDSDGCETSLVFDGSNCGRRCEDGECKDRTCNVRTIVQDPLDDMQLVQPVEVAGDRVFFATAGQIWSAPKDGGDARIEVSSTALKSAGAPKVLDTIHFMVDGDGIIISIPGSSVEPFPPSEEKGTPGIFRFDRKTGEVSALMLVDPEQNRCAGEIWLHGSETITACFLPPRSFNPAPQLAVLAVSASGAVRTIFREHSNFKTGALAAVVHGFAVVKGVMDTSPTDGSAISRSTLQGACGSTTGSITTASMVRVSRS